LTSLLLENVTYDYLHNQNNDFLTFEGHFTFQYRRLHQFKTNRRQVDFAMTQNSDFLTSNIILVIDM